MPSRLPIVNRQTAGATASKSKWVAANSSVSSALLGAHFARAPSCVIGRAVAQERLLRKYVGPGRRTGPGIEYSHGAGRSLAACAHFAPPFSCVTGCAPGREGLL